MIFRARWLLSAVNEASDLRQLRLFTGADFLNEFWSLELGWLCHTVAVWTAYPYCVRLVQVILANRSSPLGNMSDTQLFLKIMEGVPKAAGTAQWI